MAWEENSRICLHMQLIAILSRIGVIFCLLIDKFSLIGIFFSSNSCIDIRCKYTFLRIAGTKLCISYFSSKNICKNFAVSIISYTFASEFHADGSKAILIVVNCCGRMGLYKIWEGVC